MPAPAQTIVDGLKELVVVGPGAKAPDPKVRAEAIEEPMDGRFEALGLAPELLAKAVRGRLKEPVSDLLEGRVLVRPAGGLGQKEPLLGPKELGLRLLFVDEAAGRVEEVAAAAPRFGNPNRFEVNGPAVVETAEGIVQRTADRGPELRRRRLEVRACETKSGEERAILEAHHRGRHHLRVEQDVAARLVTGHLAALLRVGHGDEPCAVAVASNHDLAKVRVTLGGLAERDLPKPKERDREHHHHPPSRCKAPEKADEQAHAEERKEARSLAATDELRLGERAIHGDPSAHALPPSPKDRRDRPEVTEARRKKRGGEEHPEEAGLGMVEHHHGSTAEESPNLPMIVVESAQTPPKMSPAIASRPPKLSKPSPRT